MPLLVNRERPLRASPAERGGSALDVDMALFAPPMKGDDYMQGRHFWTHFWIGLVVGGFLGVRVSWDLFDSRLAFIGCAAGIALVFALAVGYWGDPLWRWILEWWPWW